MTVENPPFDATAMVRDEVAALIRGEMALVEERLRRAHIGPNGVEMPAVPEGLVIPTGRAFVPGALITLAEGMKSPGIVHFADDELLWLWLFVHTPSVGADITVDVQRWRGGSATAMNSAALRPTIVAGAHVGALAGSSLDFPTVRRGDWTYAEVVSPGGSTKGQTLTVVPEWAAKIKRGRDF